MDSRLRYYVYGVIAAGTAVLGMAIRAHPFRSTQHDIVLMALLIALSALTYLAPVRLSAKRGLVLNVTLQTVALLTLQPGPAAAVIALGTLTGNLYVHRRWFESLFDAAQGALAVVAAGAVYQVLAATSLAAPGHDLRSALAVIPAGIVLFAITVLAADIAAAMQRHGWSFSDWLETHALDLASHIALVAVGAATVTAINRAPWLMLLAVVPVAAIRSSLRTAIGFNSATVRIVEEIADAAESRHPHLAGSARRVAEMADALARARGLPETECRRIRIAAHLHDIAMALLPDFVELGGPGACDEHERFFWGTHCQVGADLVSRVLKLPGVAGAIEYHHERIDGRGYPHGLRGLDIPLDARIVAVSEAWVALTSTRGYRPALGVHQTLEVLHAGGGTQWDAGLVEALTALVRGAPAPQISTRVGRQTRLLAPTSLS